MLVLISDLHISDGTAADTVAQGAFRAFAECLHDRIHDACWRADGSFRPIERCDVILLGDVFDSIRSDEWLKEDGIRPWSELEEIGPRVKAITAAAIEHNAEGLARLKDLSGTLQVRSDAAGHEVEVPVFIHYFVGNHDWFYCAPGKDFDEARQLLVDAMGLANDPKQPFPHVLTEASAELQELLAAHVTHVQHGDLQDTFNYEAEKGRAHSSLGDALTVELTAGLAQSVEERFCLPPDDTLCVALREIDLVRPSLALPDWLNGIMRLHPKRQTEIAHVWDQRVDAFLETPFVREHDRPWRLDTVDLLAITLKLTTHSKLGRAATWFDKIGHLRLPRRWGSKAIKDKAIVDRQAHYIVWGHTHSPETVPLEMIPQGNGTTIDQVYLNTGTWTSVLERCQSDPDGIEFKKVHNLTYACIYRDTERGGRRFESWTGLMG